MFDSKRNAFALIICFLVVMIYTDLVIAPYNKRLNPPRTAVPTAPITPEAERFVTSVPPASTTTILPSAGGITNASTPTSVAPTTPPVARAGNPTPAEINAAPRTVIRTPLTNIVFTHLGARIKSLELMNYRRMVGSDEPLDLISAIEGAPLPLAVYTSGISDAFVEYTLQGVSVPAAADGAYVVAPGRELSLSFIGTLPNGNGISKTVRISGDTYLLEVDVRLAAPPADGSRLWLEWTRFVPDHLANDSYQLEGFTLLDLGLSLSHRYFSSLGPGIVDAGALKWIASGDKYFMTVLIPAATGPNARLGRIENMFIHQASADPSGGAFAVYSGPKDFSTLRLKGYELERAIDLGIFTVLAAPLLHLMRFFYSILGNYGLAIIVLTLFIKTLFLPLTRASFKSMQAMQDLAPEMKALRERIKDPNQLNQEVLALYKKRGVNPMGGCLPMIIQLPVFLGLYNALLNAIELRHARFALWINDLSAPEVFPVMLLLMAGSMLLQTWLMPSGADPQQRKIMMILPLVFAVMFIIIPLPSGLVLYWLVNNTISIIQQVYLKSDRKASPLQATLLGSAIMFVVGYVLTLL